MLINTVIFGSGQIGTMIARLLGADYRVICFADNSDKRQGTSVSGIKIFSPEDTINMKPECYCIGVLDDERAGQMEKQLRELGYEGPVIRPHELNLFDSRIATMKLLAERINRDEIPGSTAELGVFQGAFARHINSAFPGRKLHLYDTFEGFLETDVQKEKLNGFSKAKIGDFAETSQEAVYESMPYKQNVIMHKGYFPDTFTEYDETFCFISLDPDLYEPTKSGLEIFWPRLSKGGVIMVHDYNSTQYRGAGNAVDEFLKTVDDAVTFPVCDLHGSLVIQKI